MNDPRRLLDEEPDEFPARLLRSWQSYQPSARALQKAAVALGLGTAAFSASSAAAAVAAGAAKAGTDSASTVAAKLVLLKWFGGTMVWVGMELIRAVRRQSKGRRCLPLARARAREAKPPSRPRASTISPTRA